MTYSPEVKIPKIGRPTKYREDMCKIVIEVMARGESKLSVALELDIGESTLYEWRDKFPEFAESLKMGELACKVWWERLCRDESMGVEGANVKAGSIMFMRNVLKWDTRDKETLVNEINAIKGTMEKMVELTKEEWDKKYEV